jgi:type IV secretory pathway VirB3-like protein
VLAVLPLLHAMLRVGTGHERSIDTADPQLVLFIRHQINVLAVLPLLHAMLRVGTGHESDHVRVIDTADPQLVLLDTK